MNKRQPMRERWSAGAFTLIEIMVVVSIIAILLALGVGAGMKASRDARRKQARALLAAVQTIATEYQTLTRRGIDPGWVVNHSQHVEAPINWLDPEERLETDVRPDELDREDEAVAVKIDAADDGGIRGKLNAEPTEAIHTFMTSVDPTSEQTHVTIERFVWAMWQLPQTRRMVQDLGKKYLGDLDGDDFLEIIDPWETPLFYCAYVDHSDEARVDDSFAERKAWRLNQDPADFRSHWRAVFMSAGENTLWGKVKRRSEFATEKAYETYLRSKDYEQSSDNLYSDELD